MVSKLIDKDKNKFFDLLVKNNKNQSKGHPDVSFKSLENPNKKIILRKSRFGWFLNQLKSGFGLEKSCSKKFFF